jgi:hypothetical protein
MWYALCGGIATALRLSAPSRAEYKEREADLKREAQKARRKRQRLGHAEVRTAG